MTIRVFLADDHAVLRDGLRALLEADPEITVVGEASGGLQAVSETLNLAPDVVIMDISMPDLNGLEATQQILEQLPQTQVIILSMLGTSNHVRRALQAGVRGYLLKESAGREVVNAVLAVKAGNVYLSAPVTNLVVQDYVEQARQADKQSPLERLSRREREILVQVVDGKTSVQIAEMLFLSPKTVESYRSRLMQKLGLPDLPSLVKFAIQAGLVTPKDL